MGVEGWIDTAIQEVVEVRDSLAIRVPAILKRSYSKKNT